MTKWERAETADQVTAIIEQWDHYGIFQEKLTRDDIEYLLSGGCLCVYQGEYGLILRLQGDNEPA